MSFPITENYPWLIWKKKKKKRKSHYINPKGKFILLSQEQRQGPRLKVSFEGLSLEIHILIRSPIQVITEAVVYCTWQLTVAVCQYLHFYQMLFCLVTTNVLVHHRYPVLACADNFYARAIKSIYVCIWNEKMKRLSNLWYL